MRRGVSNEDLDKIPPIIESTSPTDLVQAARAVYLLRSGEPRDVTAEVSDVKRAWSASENREDGRSTVGRVMSADFIREKTHTVTKAIAKVFDGPGLKFEELKSKDGTPLPFLGPNIRKAETIRRLLAFWESSVPESSVAGFVGRFYGETLQHRVQLFRTKWTVELLSNAESRDLKTLASFLADNSVPPSPSGASARRVLERLLEQELEPLEDSGLSVRGSASHTRDSRGKRSRRKNSWSRRKQVIGSNSPSSEESDGEDIDSGSPYSSSYDNSNDERSGKKTGLSLPFRGLPKKMIQVLKQGGKGFEIFFEPLQVDVTKTAELFKLLRHYREGTQLITQICRSNGLTLDPQDCLSKLERTPLYMVRPDHRIDAHLAFPRTERIAPREVRRWMKHGSIIPWVEALAAKAGTVDKDNANAYVAREIMNECLWVCTIYFWNTV